MTSISNITQTNNNINVEHFDIVISEAIRIVYEIEKSLGRNITYDATKVSIVLPNTTNAQYATQIANELNTFKYYVEGVSLTTIATLGLLGIL